jgi:hypothetical protein
VSNTSPDDQAALRHGAAPAAERLAQPGELLFEFHVARTHTFYRVELRDHGPVYGVEAQFLNPIDLWIARTFRSSNDPTGTRTAREMAIAWAIEERKAIEATR